MELNSEQLLAVKTIHGPLIIFAGAGSGKTRVIVHRIQYMIQNHIPGHSIIAVTFTNKSAKEMKDRLKTLVDKIHLRGMIISTFHALGNKILQKEIEILGYRTPFTIMDETDRLLLLRNIYKDFKLNPEDAKDDNILFLISLFKNSSKSIEQWAKENEFLLKQIHIDTFIQIYKSYQKTLFSLNAVDFDDLILLPIKIFKNYPHILEKYHKRYKYFLVDEFQDTNPLQYELLKLLSSHTHHLCVVGDDDQSIYGWRGADVSIIQNFQNDYPNATRIILYKNYRSTQNILDVANAVIKNNTKRIDKKIISMNAKGSKIKIIECYDEKEEAEKVVELIQKKIIKEKRKPSDFAILYRTNYQSRAFESELRKRNIPHYVVGGYRFFDRKEVKDILAYLRVIANPHDEISLLRIINFPKRGLGDATIEKIHQFIFDKQENQNEKISFIDALYLLVKEPHLIKGIQTNQIEAILNFIEFLEKYKKEFSLSRSMSKTLYKMVQELQLEQEFAKEQEKEEVIRAKMFHISEIINMLSFFEEEWEEQHPPTLFDFLSRVSLLSSSEAENYKQEKGKVQLLTLHLSKGLEFDIVFMCGMNEKIFPAERSLLESKELELSLEEERRLCYVGITRAKKELYLTYTLYRRMFGNEVQQEPSRFLNEIPEELVERETHLTKEDNENHLKEFVNHIKNILAS